MTAAEAGLTLICPACGQRFAAPPRPAAVVPASDLVPPPVERRWYGLGVVTLVLVAAAAALAGSLWFLHHSTHAPPPPAAAVATRPTRPVTRPLPATRPAATSRPATAPVARPATRPETRPATRPTTTPTTAPEVPPPPTPVAAALVPVRPPTPPPDLDDRIGGAIDRGVGYLLTRFHDGRLPEATAGDGVPAGADALAVYALLQAAQAVDRPDLHVDAPLTARLLDTLRAMPMTQTYTTYDRSLRAAALAVYNRKADRVALRLDAGYLINQSRGGGYTYPMSPGPLPPYHPTRPGVMPGGTWDNSNSQYGALGVWSALDAGVEVPSRYWEGVRQHWLATQLRDGQWGYSPDIPAGKLSMTVAGVTTLLVAEDQLGAAEVISHMGRSPYTPAVAAGLAWLEAGDHAVALPADYPTYALYGIERAALASGFKTFGRHDWYRELAAQRLSLQQPDGSWTDGGDPLVDTAYTLLFLARGRHPLLMNKLRFAGPWANRPRDLEHLTAFAARELERPLNWQVVSAADDWTTWTDAPVLYIASHEPIPLDEVTVAKLKAYADNGGLIFTSTDAGATAFDASVAELAGRLSHHPFRQLPADDPVYRSLFPLAKAGAAVPPLVGVGNGSRLLLVHSPQDLGRTWQLRETVTHPVPFEVGLNVFIDAAGKGGLRNRLRPAYLPEPAVTPVGRTAVARVRYDGDWDPEPAAAGRFARAFLGETSIAVDVVDVRPEQLDIGQTPLAMLTGTGDVRLLRPQVQALHDYVAAGGVLLIDACGGSAAFAGSVRADLLPAAFPGAALADLPADHPIAAGTGPGMAPVDGRLRPFAAERAGVHREPLRSLTLGRGLVLFSPLDVTSGLLDTNAWPIDGYDPADAYGWARNALLYAVDRPGR